MLKTIPNYTDYLIDDTGIVYSLKHSRTLRPLKQQKTKDNYWTVRLYKDGKWKVFRVHQLVLIAFIGPCPEGMECRHLDGNKNNNNLTNLRWGTRSENQQDALRHGTHNYNHSVGSECSSAKLNEEQVRMIIYIWNTKLFLQKEIAKMYGISTATVCEIVNKTSWRHLWK
jgi:hypothetical protein